MNAGWVGKYLYGSSRGLFHGMSQRSLQRLSITCVRIADNWAGTRTQYFPDTSLEQ
jgi:hypothetical protein